MARPTPAFRKSLLSSALYTKTVNLSETLVNTVTSLPEEYYAIDYL